MPGNTKASFIDKATGIPKTFVDRYDLSGRWGYCTLKDGTRFKFDKKDFDLIKSYRWRFNRGRITAYGIDCESTVIDLKRIILADVLNSKKYKDRKINVIFKNKDPLDYRRSNLIIIDSSKRVFNAKKSINNTSGIIGVSVDKKSGKWRAYINYKGKQIHLGFYNNFEGAIIARLKAEVEYFGELAPQQNLFSVYGLYWKELIQAKKQQDKQIIRKQKEKTRKQYQQYLFERYVAYNEKFANNTDKIKIGNNNFLNYEIGIVERSIEGEIEAVEEQFALNNRYYSSEWY